MSERTLAEGEIEVVTRDWEGNEECAVIRDDYVLVTAGNRFLDGVQAYGNGTVILTVKLKTLTAPAHRPFAGGAEA